MAVKDLTATAFADSVSLRVSEGEGLADGERSTAWVLPQELRPAGALPLFDGDDSETCITAFDNGGCGTSLLLHGDFSRSSTCIFSEDNN